MKRLSLLLLLAACGPTEAPTESKPPGGDDTAPVGCDTMWYADADGDGYGDAAVGFNACEPPGREVANADDCDDQNAAAYPGAPEDCTVTFDANCDGSVGFVDEDRDGVAACEDCDDTNPSIKPGAAEFCDGIDSDCDGTADEEPVDGTLWYADADGDGRGDRTTATRACTQPEGYGTDFADCDDTNAAITPDATETCNGIDDDCDGTADDDAADAVTWWGDADADGYGDDRTRESGCAAPSGSASVGGDCEDADPAVNPGAAEVCNDLDDDCSGTVDTDAIDPATWYLDRDGDGFGDAAYTVATCDRPAGYVATDGDCDDTDATAHPAASETCDGTDDDCDGTVDEDDATDAGTWYADADGDGYGVAGASVRACEAPAGHVALGTDCDDGTAAVSPGAPETCNAIDDDCDGTTDEDAAVDAPTWYRDADGDGFGGAETWAACAMPAGYAATDDDCDDADLTVSPDGVELCNAVDDDCDGATDEDDALDAPAWYADVDGDGYGDAADAAPACAAPAGRVADATDCDDADEAFHPGAAEPDCDDPNDYNCDGSVGLDDVDGDGFAACAECDDADAAVFPGAFEACNLVDDDCDGTVDGEDAVGAGTWYADADGDGYGDVSVVDHSCELPPGFVTDASDCDDGEAGVNPGETEVCATDWDDDCDGDADELRTPDCTRFYLDFDEDGYGSTTSVCACDASEWFTADNAEDCDDGDAGANPGGTELRGNGVDDDCDGLVDAASTSTADAVIAGDTADENAGGDIAAGDVDGDGAIDLLLGLPSDATSGAATGAAVLLYGSFSGTTYTSAADARLLGAMVGDSAGSAVALGDVDGDGYADALVGASDAGGGARGSGVAYLVYGPLSGEIDLGAADAELDGVASDDAAGNEVAFAGDVDGDGVGDLLVGAPAADAGGRSSGSAYLVLGGVSGSVSLASAEAELYGASSSDTVGDALAPAGDTNGDGFADFLVGVQNDDDSGSGSGTTYVFEGPVSGAASIVGASAAQLVGEAVGDNAGASVAGVGDLDGDGYDDVFVGAPGAGTAYVMLSPFSGRMALSGADATLEGDPDSSAGYPVCSPGDTDGDSVPDLLIGGYTDGTGGTNAGAVWLWSGVPSGTVSLADATLLYGGAADRAGIDLASAGDDDGDGIYDFFVGAFGADPGAEDGGAVYLFRGM